MNGAFTSLLIVEVVLTAAAIAMFLWSEDLRQKFTGAGYAEYLDKLNDAVANWSMRHERARVSFRALV